MSLKTVFDAAERLLHESTNEDPSVQVQSSSNNRNDNGDEFNYVIFWVLNAVVIVIIISVLLWCCKFGGAELLVKFSSRISNRSNSDMEYARRVVARQRQEEEKKKEVPGKRKMKLRQSFRRNKVVEEKDFVTEKPMEESAEKEHDLEAGSDQNTSATVAQAVDEIDLAGGNGFLVLQTAKGSRTVPNCCAVCLGAYEVGEKVVWSAYDKCPHAFHEECVVDWFIKMQKGTPCPCCRGEFTDLSEIERKRKEEKLVAQTTQFNVGAISL